METSQNTQIEDQQDVIGIEDIFYMCLNRWYWFVISLGVTLGLAVAYLLVTPPTYTRSAELLIKKESKGSSMANMEQAFSDMGMFVKSNTNVNNEIISLKSPALMYEVVKRLRLDMNYSFDGRFHKQVAYGVSLPVMVTMLDITDEWESNSFVLDLKGNAYTISEFTRKGEDVESKPVKGRLNDTISSPLGRLVVEPTASYVEDNVLSLYVNKVPLYSLANACASRLSAVLAEEKATVVSLAYSDVCPQRADDILNTLIAVYNENWIKDKNQVAISTSMFINERLQVIERDLGHVDESISSYKSENLLPNINTASNLYLTQSTQSDVQLMALNNQLYMSRYIRNYLTDGSHKFQLLPVNSGIESANIEAQISEYNNKLLQRNGLVANSSEKNPLVVDLDQALESMRQAVVVSIDNQMEALNAQIRSLEQSVKKTTSKIAANPTQAKYLLSVERQQKVKEALYLFLLQKREENELSQAFTAYNTRVITPPGGSPIPNAPKKNMILFAAFIFGLAIPVGAIFLREMMNTKVRGRKDLDKLTVPFLGEIPLYFSGKKNTWWKRVDTDAHTNQVVVKAGRRDIINEAFRVLRTNLEFMTEKNSKSNVIVVTSFNPGSGKSFLTMNTATCLALKQKKVLVIDGDMRHASASTFVNSPKHGLSDYLAGRIENVNDVIVKISGNGTLNVLPVGTIPPNPTELLYEQRLADLLAMAREKYDYVLIDCPPIEMVADTQIIEKLADRAVFVVRAGLMERSMLVELQNIYDKTKFKNMALILNGTTAATGHYGHRYGYRYGYKYAYRYGYNYGYGSDYHYGSTEDEK